MRPAELARELREMAGDGAPGDAGGTMSAPEVSRSVRWGAGACPIFAHHELPVPYAVGEDALFVRPDIDAPALAAAIWRFLSLVGGFQGDAAAVTAAILPTAKNRLRTIRRHEAKRAEQASAAALASA